MINDLDTQYIKTCDNHVGVIVGETPTTIKAIMPWNGVNGVTRFMKDSRRQIGTPDRSFDYVGTLADV